MPVRTLRLPPDVRDLFAQSFPGLDLDRVRIRVGLPWWTRFAPIRVRAITLRDRVFVAPDVDLRSPAGISLLAHELVHVAQWHRAGRRAPPGLRWAVFPIRYVGSYLRARLRGMDRTSAYRAIPCEREARRFERAVIARLTGRSRRRRGE